MFSVTAVLPQGCHLGLMPHLPSIVNMLVPLVADPRPMVRVISHWSLARFSGRVLESARDPSGAGAGWRGLLDSIVDALLRGLADRNKVCLLW